MKAKLGLIMAIVLGALVVVTVLTIGATKCTPTSHETSNDKSHVSISSKIKS